MDALVRNLLDPLAPLQHQPGQFLQQKFRKHPLAMQLTAVESIVD